MCAIILPSAEGINIVTFLSVKRGLSENSIRMVVGRYRIYKKWIQDNNLTHSKRSVEDFMYFLKSQGKKNNTLNCYVFMFKELALFFQDRSIKTDDFAKDLKLFDKIPRPIQILTPEEIETIIGTTVPYGYMTKPWRSAEEVTEENNFLYQTLTRFLATTGCRYGEAASLRMKHLELSAGKVTFVETKNKSNRSVWILEPLISDLKDMTRDKEEEDFVFTNLRGKPLILTNYNLWLHRAREICRIKKRVHPHLFRHSFATQLIMSGVDITAVATILGHKDIQTTYNSYVRLADQTLRKSIMRHPLNRKNIDPREMIKMIHDYINGLKIDDDSRLNFSLKEDPSSLEFSISVLGEGRCAIPHPSIP